WQIIKVPHDWAISGAFDEDIDAQTVMVWQDGDKVPGLRTGRTGALPYVGVGWYRKEIVIPQSYKGKKVSLEFDGAMSHAQIYMNGNYVGEWPYGYASFSMDITPFIKLGETNVVAVRLKNEELSSRWYSGAGIYREVRLLATHPVHVIYNGTYITTPEITEKDAIVKVVTNIQGVNGETVDVITSIFDEQGNRIDFDKEVVSKQGENAVTSELKVAEPMLWSLEKPNLYIAKIEILQNGELIDNYESRFGIRDIEFDANKGFFLNGVPTKMNGVCLHHDLGPLGAAYNHSAMRYRLKMLKEMGCNAIRTSHNPMAPQMLDLCDEMGFLVIDEAFDEWQYVKCKNGYNTLFKEWGAKDLTAFLHRDRNHPSVILWSIGNEVKEQNKEDGRVIAENLIRICKQEDPTRLVTVGMNNPNSALKYKWNEIFDVLGYNYKPHMYQKSHQMYPDRPVLGSETASTVSSRGEYFFPAKNRQALNRPSLHCSSYDLEYPSWATTPDTEFAAQDDMSFVLGEFVWTGFDYLGEPTPYNAEWPSRSSYFGIIDLCGIPKDRFYLYQSRWTKKEVLHLLPHWNWENNEQKLIPVHCYTSFETAELFLNGKSLGKRTKNKNKLYERYRLVWDDVKYEAGELRVVGYRDGEAIAESVMKTAGEPAVIRIEADRDNLLSNNNDIAFVTVGVYDKEGNLCPKANNQIQFEVSGAGRFKAVGNGDPTSLESFVQPTRKLFNGKAMLLVESGALSGEIFVKAFADGLKSDDIIILVK
ncbi:DUF4982 domain-containing protein, partial [bacterium]|nr:DUF4982 domain-containing protein [bacterium]